MPGVPATVVGGRRRWPAVTVLLVALALLGPAAGAGDDPVAGDGAEPRGALGAAFQISGPASVGNDFDAEVAHNTTDGGYLVVWETNRYLDTRGTGIYGQLVSDTGDRVGPSFRIRDAVTGERNPSVAYNAAQNEYVVVWDDTRHWATSGHDIYGRRLSAAGIRLGADFRVSGPNLLAKDAEPDVVYNAESDEYLVVWYAYSGVQSNEGDRIYGQRLSAAGARLGFTFTIAGWGGQWVKDPAVAWNSTANTYLVSWQDSRNWGTHREDIYGQRLTARGKRLGGNFRISGGAAVEIDAEPAIAYNSSANQFLVVWTDYRAIYDMPPGRTDIYGQRLSSTGTRLGANVRITGGAATQANRAADVAYDPDANRYLVAWRDFRYYDYDPSPVGAQVYGQRVSAGGVRVGANIRLNSDVVTCADNFGPAVAYNPSAGEHLVVWEIAPPPPIEGCETYPDLDWDVYGRRWTL